MAQELMRHSDIRLTMNTYTHLALIDTAGAVETLPSINMAKAAPQVATGTNGPVTSAGISATGAGIGDGLQPDFARDCHNVAQRPARPAREESPQVSPPTQQRHTMARSGTRCHKASEGNRTLNPRFTKAVLYR